jgi:hypothetical protein
LFSHFAQDIKKISTARRLLNSSSKIDTIAELRSQSSLNIRGIIDATILLVFDTREIPSAISGGLTAQAGRQ